MNNTISILHRTKRSLGLAITFGCSLLAGNAFAEVGHALFSVGSVAVERAGATLQLGKGRGVEAGDIIVTGVDGRVQLKMTDGSRIAIRPNSRFEIEAFELPVPSAENPSTGAGDDGKSIYRLLKGGFRTVTGAIGKPAANGSAETSTSGGGQSGYEVRTTVATIGIRGTVYTAAFADPKVCQDAWGEDAPPANDNGALYIGVSLGKIVLRNGAGEFETARGEYACVLDFDFAPISVSDMPLALSSEAAAPLRPPKRPRRSGRARNTETAETVDAGDDADTANAISPPKPPPKGRSFGGPSSFAVPGTEGLPPPAGEEPIIPVGSGGDEPLDDGGTQAAEIAIAAGGVGSVTGFVTSPRSDQGRTQVDGNGNLTEFGGRLPGGTPGAYRLDDGGLVNQGFDPTTGLRWGRWSSGGAVPISGGPERDVQDLHWVTADASFDSPAVPSGGNRSYMLIGNTNPTDSQGNVGLLGEATLDANFDNQTVDSTVDLTIDGSVWSAVGSGELGSDRPNAFSGNYDVTVDGQQGGDGEFTGFFTDGADAAGLGYNLSSPTGDSDVQGTTAFEATP